MDDTGLRVGFSKVFGGIFLALSVTNLVLGVLTHATMSMVTGGFLSLVAILQLVMPYFILHAGSGVIELKNLLGMTVRRYTFESLRDFHVEAGKIYLVDAGGNRRSVKLTRWIAHRPDWDRFVAALQAKEFE